MAKQGKQGNVAEVKEITDSEFETFLKSGNLVVADFWAEWCMPCVIQGPIVEELAQFYSGKIHFAKINVDENQATASKYKILSIPSLLVFKSGQVVDRIVGTTSFDSLKDKLAKYTS